MISHEKLQELIEDVVLTDPAPENEPMRQYYYIKKARQYVEAERVRLGRTPTCCVVTFGCQMNTEHETRKKPQIRGFFF